MSHRRIRSPYSTRSKRPKRPYKKRLLIICEGRETEPNYFDRLKREDRTREHFAITVKRGKGGTREEIAQFAIDQMNNAEYGFDKVWCIMDVEDASHRGSLENALRMLGQNRISPCLSNPSFEVWFLSHFVRTSQVFYNCDQVISELCQHWQRHLRSDYKKAEPSIFNLLKRFMDKAIENARLVRKQTMMLRDIRPTAILPRMFINWWKS